MLNIRVLALGLSSQVSGGTCSGFPEVGGGLPYVTSYRYLRYSTCTAALADPGNREDESLESDDKSLTSPCYRGAPARWCVSIMASSQSSAWVSARGLLRTISESDGFAVSHVGACRAFCSEHSPRRPGNWPGRT